MYRNRLFLISTVFCLKLLQKFANISGLVSSELKRNSTFKNENWREKKTNKLIILGQMFIAAIYFYIFLNSETTN